MDQAVLSAHEVSVADLLLEALERKLDEPVDGVAQHGLENRMFVFANVSSI